MDYTKLGFKSGLEIHQQLDTAKLFCSCPSVLRQDEPDFTITRKLHAVAGESGKVDVAAKHEASQDKEFVYQGYDSRDKFDLPDDSGVRPFEGADSTFGDQPLWKDLLLFHEYFDGDDGKGLGASHQTGWTGLVAELIGRA